MVDIHHHLLAGLDDGAADEAASVAMAKLAVADGITHVVCTPHANGRYSYERADNEARVAALQRRLEHEDVALTLGLGCDFHVSYDSVREALADPRRFSINRMQYMLVELPDYGIPPGISHTFDELQQVGLRLILTHPERNPTLVANPQRIVDWLRAGMLVQVTADSLTGQMGKDAQKMAHDLLQRRWVHFLASDAHNVSSRPPRMRAAREILERKYGAETAAALCETNPRAVFFGEPLGVQADALEMDEGFAKRSWLDRLLRR